MQFYHLLKTLLPHLLLDFVPEFLQANVWAVLGGDDDGVDPDGDARPILKLVLAGHLGLGVGQGPPQSLVAP